MEEIEMAYKENEEEYKLLTEAMDGGARSRPGIGRRKLLQEKYIKREWRGREKRETRNDLLYRALSAKS